MVEDYEHIRGQALGGRFSGVRLGLAVLLHKGMAVWAEQWSLLLAPSQNANRALPEASESAVAEEHCSELVNLLTDLTLLRMQEVTP
jgi:hypothetical protein